MSHESADSQQDPDQTRKISLSIPEEKMPDPDTYYQEILKLLEQNPGIRLSKTGIDPLSGNYLYSFDIDPKVNQNRPVQDVLEQTILQHLGVALHDGSVRILRHVMQGGKGFIEGFTGLEFDNILKPETQNEAEQRDWNRKVGAALGVHLFIQGAGEAIDWAAENIDPDTFKAAGSGAAALGAIVSTPIIIAAGVATVCVGGICYLVYRYNQDCSSKIRSDFLDVSKGYRTLEDQLFKFLEMLWQEECTRSSRKIEINLIYKVTDSAL